MTVSYPTPLSHAEDILNTFFIDAKAKYLAGQAEHGGRLWRKPVLPMLYQEVLDLPIYLLTLIDQIAEVKRLVGVAYWANKDNIEVDANLTKAMNILNFGNADGVAEENR